AAAGPRGKGCESCACAGLQQKPCAMQDRLPMESIVLDAETFFLPAVDPLRTQPGTAVECGFNEIKDADGGSRPRPPGFLSCAVGPGLPGRGLLSFGAVVRPANLPGETRRRGSGRPARDRPARIASGSRDRSAGRRAPSQEGTH